MLDQGCTESPPESRKREAEAISEAVDIDVDVEADVEIKEEVAPLHYARHRRSPRQHRWHFLQPPLWEAAIEPANTTVARSTQMICLRCGVNIVKPSSQKQRKRIKTVCWFAEEAASRAAGKPKDQLSPEEVMGEMIRNHTTVRGSQSLDGEALDKKAANKIIERLDKDVEYTMHSVSGGYNREFLAVEDVSQ